MSDRIKILIRTTQYAISVVPAGENIGSEIL